MRVPTGPAQPGQPTLADLLPQVLPRRLGDLHGRHETFGGPGRHCGNRRSRSGRQVGGTSRLFAVRNAAGRLSGRRHGRGFYSNHGLRESTTRKKTAFEGSGQKLETDFRVAAARALIWGGLA